MNEIDDFVMQIIRILLIQTPFKCYCKWEAGQPGQFQTFFQRNGQDENFNYCGIVFCFEGWIVCVYSTTLKSLVE